MKLTDRLYKIASFVSEGKRVADIGTDHGYIPVYLLNKGTIPFAILADINKGPLENARKEVRHNGLEDKTETEKLILQPMQAQEELRKYLLNNGYEIMEEVLENEDFRIYEIMTARYTGKNNVPSDEIYYEVGEKLLNNKNELFKEFVEKKIRTNRAILEKFEGIDNENIRKRRIYYEVGEKLLNNKNELFKEFVEKKIRTNRAILEKFEGIDNENIRKRREEVESKIEKLEKML